MGNSTHNPSIRSALSAHLSHEAKTILPTSPEPTTTPVKCNIKLRNRPYQAIIDSGASISMIAYKVVQELELKIEQASTSLIISTTGTSFRPLGIIKDLSVEIEEVTIPLDVKIMPATSYLLLLGNDWSQKVDATYSWKNKAYTLK